MPKRKYCCERFAADAEEGNGIAYAGKNDETEWYIKEGSHIYYCPFCGAFIKGKGYGNYDEKYPPKIK